MKAPKLLQLLSLTGCLLAAAPPVSYAGTNLDIAHQLNEAFVEVAERVSPSVVVISVIEKPVVWPGDAPADNRDSTNSPTDSTPRDFWRNFHRQFEEGAPERNRGQGSGVIVRTNGYIVTNRHVVEDAEQIEVRLFDGRTFKATVRGMDPGSDIAVIKIDADNLRVARFGDSARARVGEFAIAIGAPFAYDFSVTFGHVSAKGRSNVVPMFEGGGAMDQDFIQTDANINPGNSGGPLLNLDGEVIGINTLIRGLQTGIGFAIPSNLAKEVSEKLIAQGKFVRPWLGISIRSLKDDVDIHQLVKGLDNGVVVKSVFPDGPSAKADVRPSDIIVKVDGASVATVQQLRDEVRGKPVGQPVTLELFRDGKTMRVKVSPAEFMDPSLTVVRTNPAHEDAAPSGLGITVHALTQELAGQFGVGMTSGVVVVSVDQRSAAARKGIKPGDIITAIAQQPVTNPKQFREAAQKADLKKGVLINLLSGDTARYEILKEGNE